MGRHVSAVALRWAIVIPASLGLGWLFTLWHLPASWILAAIVVAGACALITGEDLPLNKGVNVFGRSMIAILAALPLLDAPVAQLLRYLLPGLLVSLITVGIGVAGGIMLSRSQKAISPETGVLSMLAGGASVMTVLAQQLGADYRYVTLSQYLRLLVVSISLPLVTHLFVPGTGGAGRVRPEGLEVFGLGEVEASIGIVVILGIVVVGEPLGRLLRLPAPAVLGPLLCTVVVGALFPVDLEPPTPFVIIAFLSIGWMCGGALNMPALRVFSRQLPATFAFIFVLLGLCAATAAVLSRWLGISYFEAYLATSPGALETVLALSSEGAAGPVVVTIQIIRLLSILAIAGWLPGILRLILPRR
ncbi:AbrB family transcriptional regulator [Corynebacterium pacaense]|uniref:AbrB family transcriptional regulator n=1 Tax=Corynebacterium pacaense TaxID=1816684 RepID=UPI0009BA78AC|nr:AbrB family transcriptional regulator [Corynebacterium pacaense]